MFQNGADFKQSSFSGSTEMGFFEQISRESAQFFGRSRLFARRFLKPHFSTQGLTATLQGLAAKYGPRVALVGREEVLTFSQWNDRVNRFARWARAQQFEPSTRIAVLMPDGPDLVCLWQGLAQRGLVSCVLSPDHMDDLPAHLRQLGAKMLIVAGDFAQRVAAMENVLGGVEVLILGDSALGNDPAFPSLDTRIAGFSRANIPLAEQLDLAPSAPCLILFSQIYGFVPLDRARVLDLMIGTGSAAHINRDDSVLITLPLCEPEGLALLGSALLAGGCALVCGTAQASFWRDVARYEPSVVGGDDALWLGIWLERSSPLKSHGLRLVLAANVASEAANRFAERFGIPEILAFHHSAYGTVSFYNFDGRPGFIGRPFPHGKDDLARLALVKRSETGAATPMLRVAPDEPGFLLVRLDAPEAARLKTLAPLLKDVFERGDIWCNTGMVMSQDASGRYALLHRPPAA